MPTIKIDNIDYDTDTLSPEARQQLEMLVATENRLRELQRDLENRGQTTVSSNPLPQSAPAA